MASSPHNRPIWWDRDLDRMGRPIRRDVREAAHEIWDRACSRARNKLGDDSDAAEIMEVCVERVSHYLNRRSVPLPAPRIAGLLMAAFHRQVQKRRLKKERLELLGGCSDLDHRFQAPDWSASIDLGLDLKQILRRLSARSTRILLRRREGVDWKSIARELGIKESAAQVGFWREVRQAQLDLLKGDSGKKREAKKTASEGGNDRSDEEDTPLVP
jgi:hypothetical protein